MAEKYSHLFIRDVLRPYKFKLAPTGGSKPFIPPRDRDSHSKKLLSQLAKIWEDKEKLNKLRTAESIPYREGTYLEFVSGEDASLTTKSLENLKKGVRLLNIREIITTDDKQQIRATVYIPNGAEGYFIEKVKDYQTKDTKEHKPKNLSLVASIESVSIALLEALWTDKKDLIPGENNMWCEVWLNISSVPQEIEAQLEDFFDILHKCDIQFKPSRIIFPERAVVLIKANQDKLIELMLRSDLLAEYRAGQETAGFWMSETSVEQGEWVKDLLKRLNIHQDADNLKVCILDTGANNGHPLLAPILSDNDMLTVDTAWGTADDHSGKGGHGTLMAGIIGYGSLEKVLAESSSVLINHKLCSVKIFPPPSATPTDKELWGDITLQGISRAEIQNPESDLLYCMAVTSKDDVEKGRPSSWSGAIDQLTYGDEETKRLIIISAGNISGNIDDYKDYPNLNSITSIENPAQSWNALTIGAYTDKVNVSDERYKNHSPIAPGGGLSPYSSTSLVWEKKWPVKPDVVFEGGNLLRSPDNKIDAHPDLDLLSTSKSFRIKPFDTFSATSAATAQASWFAAKIAAQYPGAWMETVRGLMVHSANWSSTMFQQFNLTRSKSDIRTLMKIFGYGIPDIEKALYSSESSLAMIAQEYIQPFIKNDGKPASLNEMHFYKLPWPKDVLLQLDNLKVKLKITLSYFIEPGAGEIGWKDRYRYQSHGLRFDVNSPGENEQDFIKRINVEAREEGETITSSSGSDRWSIGSNNRSYGSIHSDFWEGTAANLSTCNLIGVYPVIGWWRERKHLEKIETKTRYSLLISLETEKEDVELYTTIKNLVRVPIKIENTTPKR